MSAAVGNGKRLGSKIGERNLLRLLRPWLNEKGGLASFDTFDKVDPPSGLRMFKNVQRLPPIKGIKGIKGIK
jgi:hypothetical protein